DDAGLVIGSAPSAFLTTSLSSEPSRGDVKVTLNDTTGIAQGDRLEILSPALSHGTVTVYHNYVVKEVDGSDVYIEGTVVADITAQQVTDDGKTGDIVVNIYHLAPALIIKNGKV